MPVDEQRFLGSILAGAVGDALGGPTEFLSIQAIRERFGPAGVTGFAEEYGGRGRITDDTQLTLFTLDGLIRGHLAMRTGQLANPMPALRAAYLRWLYTQDGTETDAAAVDGWLVQQRELYHLRAPGSTCLSALHGLAGGAEPGTFTHRLNDSKGCGAVMRAAPFALWSDDPTDVFTVAAAAGALTHGHPSGYLSAGALAVLVHRLVRHEPLPAALAAARAELASWPEHDEVSAALDAAVALAGRGRPTPESIAAELGGGWVGEQALAIALLCALTGTDLPDALLLAANHSGDTDSTAAICGNILGAVHGPDALPEQWLAELELREVLVQLCADASAEFGASPPDPESWRDRYPA